jgi:hypothetical protein
MTDAKNYNSMMASHFINFNPYLIGGGRLETSKAGAIRLILPSGQNHYCDAQIDDYHLLPRKHFLWNPPVHLEIRARASHPQPPGTLGFGFWNDPFTLSLGQGGAARRLPAAPQTIWFFYGSPHNDIRLGCDLRGHGWKAASLRSLAIPSLLLAFPAGAAIVLSQIPCLRGPILRTALRFVSAEENLLDVTLTAWHRYTIDWAPYRAVFRVDDHIALEADNPPRGPLGFVAWIDNQFAVASPERGFHFGVIPTTREQWLELEICELSQETK